FAALLKERKLDAFFVSGQSDLYYLTGFLSEGFYGYFSAQGAWLLCSALLAGQVRENTEGCRLVVGKRLLKTLRELRTRHRHKRVGFDPEQVNYRLGAALAKEGVVPAECPAAALRILKDKDELACLSRACHLTALSIDFIKGRLRLGVTERQLAAELQTFYHRGGAQRVAFDLIVAMGPHTALPHHVPGETRLAKNQPVIFDIGCTVGGYRSDLTRTLQYGKMPPLFRRIYNIVQAAQHAGIREARPGSTGGRVDAASRRIISKAGYGRYFVHSTGHGVGIDIHEPPWIRAKSPDLLKPGMVLTVEPGIYLPGKFGVRIEDTMLVTEKGNEILTA
ncbi:MAG: M24 family metallopeptidase, partial [Elusimicrobiota bacterium]